MSTNLHLRKIVAILISAMLLAVSFAYYHVAHNLQVAGLFSGFAACAIYIYWIRHKLQNNTDTVLAMVLAVGAISGLLLDMDFIACLLMSYPVLFCADTLSGS